MKIAKYLPSVSRGQVQHAPAARSGDAAISKPTDPGAERQRTLATGYCIRTGSTLRLSRQGHRARFPVRMRRRVQIHGSLNALPQEEHPMSKGMDSKKAEKKKPAKTLKEKKAAKKEKKAGK